MRISHRKGIFWEICLSEITCVINSEDIPFTTFEDSRISTFYNHNTKKQHIIIKPFTKSQFWYSPNWCHQNNHLRKGFIVSQNCLLSKTNLGNKIRYHTKNRRWIVKYVLSTSALKKRTFAYYYFSNVGILGFLCVVSSSSIVGWRFLL